MVNLLEAHLSLYVTGLEPKGILKYTFLAILVEARATLYLWDTSLPEMSLVGSYENPSTSHTHYLAGSETGLT